MKETVIPTFKNQKPKVEEQPIQEKKPKRDRWNKEDTQRLIKVCKDNPNINANAICELFFHHPTRTHASITSKINYLRHTGKLPNKHKKRKTKQTTKIECDNCGEFKASVKKRLLFDDSELCNKCFKRFQRNERLTKKEKGKDPEALEKTRNAFKDLDEIHPCPKHGKPLKRIDAYSLIYTPHFQCEDCQKGD